MPSVDTALEAAKDTLTEVADVASTSVKAVGSALSEITEDERRRSRLLIALVLVILALVGIVVWRRMSSANEASAAEGHAEGQATVAT
jgi:hypothetical protein